MYQYSEYYYEYDRSLGNLYRQIENNLLLIIESKQKTNIVPCKLFIELYDNLISSNRYGQRNRVLNHIRDIFDQYYRNKLGFNNNNIITVDMLIHILKLIIPKGYNVSDPLNDGKINYASHVLYDKASNLPWHEYIEPSLTQIDKLKQNDNIKLNLYKKFLNDMIRIIPGVGENREKAVRNITRYIHKYYVCIAFKNNLNLKLYNVDIYANIISEYSV